MLLDQIDAAKLLQDALALGKQSNTGTPCRRCVSFLDQCVVDASLLRSMGQHQS